MSNEGETNTPAKSSIINYVGNFIEKRENELGTTAGADDDVRSKRRIDRDSIVIRTGEDNFDRDISRITRTSEPTDIDADELSLDADPIVETLESGEEFYRQHVYLRQYQPPTPEPIDIQVQEVFIKPQIQRPPIHVHVGAGQNRDTQRTPSPILIKTAPPQAPPYSNEPLIYHKYVPIGEKQLPQQIIIHRHPEKPPKPRPIVVEQWLPPKPAPKRITYRHADPVDIFQDTTERKRNRFIEYSKPHTTIEVEIVRLPIIKLNPDEYQNKSTELTQLEKIRSLREDSNPLQWRI